MPVSLLAFLVACATDKDQAAGDDTGGGDTSEPAECLDTRPAYAGCGSDMDVVDRATGGVVVRVHREYDADGNLVGESRDEGADGTVEQLTTSTYDADGNLLTVATDQDGDGVADTTQTFTYDADGNVLTSTIHSDADGAADVTTTYTYTDGELTGTSTDQNGDGTPEVTCTIASVDAGDGQTVTSTCTNAEGATVNTTVTTLDATGEPVARTSDNNADGTPDTEESWTRDPATCLVTASTISSTRPQGGDTVTREEAMTVTYDEEDRFATSATHVTTTTAEGETTQDLDAAATYTCSR